MLLLRRKDGTCAGRRGCSVARCEIVHATLSTVMRVPKEPGRLLAARDEPSASRVILQSHSTFATTTYG